MCVGSALAHTHRFDTATPAVNPVLMRRVELPGGWNLDDYNTTQARTCALCHASKLLRIPGFLRMFLAASRSARNRVWLWHGQKSPFAQSHEQVITEVG